MSITDVPDSGKAEDAVVVSVFQFQIVDCVEVLKLNVNLGFCKLLLTSLPEDIRRQDAGFFLIMLYFRVEYFF